MFHEEGIHSTTIQPEFVEFEDDGASASIDSAEDCILDCPSKDKDGCVANTCCGLSKQVKSASKKELRFTVIKQNGVPSPALKELPHQQEKSLSLPDISKACSLACSPQSIPPNATASVEKTCTSTQISQASVMENFAEFSSFTNDTAGVNGIGSSYHSCDKVSRDPVESSCRCIDAKDVTVRDKIGSMSQCHNTAIRDQESSCNCIDIRNVNNKLLKDLYKKNLQHTSNMNGIAHQQSYMSSVAVVIEDTEAEDFPASVRL